jgi:phage-related protein
MALKHVTFHADSLDRLRDFPEDTRQEAGHELYQVQMGRDPSDWKPMPTIGAGVREIRIRDDSGAYRVIYVATSLMLSMYFTHSRRKRRGPPAAIWSLPRGDCGS